MRGRFFGRTQGAGLALGAALLMAGCAGPAVQPGQPTKAGLTSIDGATVSLASFENSAFPYHGLIPNYQETGKSRPFLDVDDNGRLGHSSPRGGIHWEDQTYSDRSVLLAAPQSFDPNKPGVIIVFFHGNNATLSRDVIARQQIVRQLADSGLNAVLVAPQLAVDAQDSSAGRFWSAGGFAAFLGEAQSKLGDLYPNGRGAFRRMPVVIVAYSGGYLPAAYSLAVGGDQSRVRGLVLLDALYGERDKFVNWAEGPGRSAFFVSAYSTSSREGNDAVRSELEAAGVPTVSGLPGALTPGVAAFVDAGSVDHNDFVTSAWGGAPYATSSPGLAGRLVLAAEMVLKFGEIVALERAFGDRVPSRLGFLPGYFVIGRSQVKDQIIRISDVPGGRRPGVDRKRIQARIERGVSQIDFVACRRFFVSGADHVENLVDPRLVALQA